MKAKICVSSSILLFVVLACALPGIGQSAAPVIDPASIPTVIVLTANAAATQTAEVAPPVPAGSTAAVAGASQAADLTTVTTLEQLPNESAKFTDNEAGFTVTYPKGWLTVRPNSAEFKLAQETEAAKNETLKKQMDADVNDYEAGYDRLCSYPLLPDIEKNFMFGASQVTWDAADTTPINENSMGEFFRNLETSGTIPGFRTDTAQVYENAKHVNLIEVGGPFTISDGKGGFVPFYVTAVFFRPAHNGVVSILFTYLKDQTLPLRTDTAAVIDSIELTGQ
jgi:hypothetical protein